MKDLGERPLAGLFSGGLFVYSLIWLGAAVHDVALRRYPAGPAKWALRTLASYGVDAPTWLARLLLEPRPSVWLLVVPAVLATFWRAPYGVRLLFVLFSLQWCGLRATAESYLVVAVVVATASALFSFYDYREDREGYVRDAGRPSHPLWVGIGVLAEAIMHPFLFVPMQCFFKIVAGAHFDERKQTRLEFGICDELRSKPMSEMTALDLANAMWLARQAKYKPFSELSDHEKFQQWWAAAQEATLQEESEEHQDTLARRLP